MIVALQFTKLELDSKKCKIIVCMHKLVWIPESQLNLVLVSDKHIIML